MRCFTCGSKATQPVSIPRRANTASDSNGIGSRQTQTVGVQKSKHIRKELYVQSYDGSVQEVYALGKKLGEGSFGAVYVGRHKTTGHTRAIKVIEKKRMGSAAQIQDEIDVMKSLTHPNIVKLYEVFEDEKNIYLVMELCLGGELFDRIIGAGHFSETQAATVMLHIIRAVFHMHEKEVCHRDLKPENFLFATQDPINTNTLKLIDFGLAAAGRPSMSTKAGTSYYVAPEVLAGRYGRACDTWSCGVIMYLLLCGRPPFNGRDDREVLAKVRKGRLAFVDKEWSHISMDAQDLVRQLMTRNPNERCTAEQALNHDWLKHKAPKATDVALKQGFVDKLSNFQSHCRLKKAALQIIARELNDTQISQLKAAFTALDVNGDGLLTLKELKEGIQSTGLTALPADLEQIMESIDTDGSGVIEYSEFLAATLDHRKYMQEDVCKTAFDVFDLDGDGHISPEELRQVLNQGEAGEPMTRVKSDTSAVMNEVDADGDGLIDFKEFMHMMGGGRKANRTSSMFSAEPQSWLASLFTWPSAWPSVAPAGGA